MFLLFQNSFFRRASREIKKSEIRVTEPKTLRNTGRLNNGKDATTFCVNTRSCSYCNKAVIVHALKKKNIYRKSFRPQTGRSLLGA